MTRTTFPSRPRASRRYKRTLDPFPRSIEPMLAVLSELPGDPSQYNFEYKWDGVRALSYFDGSTMKIESRNRLDITRRYPELHDLRDALGKRTAVLDGEIVATDKTGKPSFTRLQTRMHVNDPAAIATLARTTPVFYVLFDLLYLDGKSLMNEPYSVRRELLEELTIAGAHWQITPAHRGEGSLMLEAARENHMEGIVAKRIDSIYEPGQRSRSWLKVKIVQRQEFVIGGWLPEKGERHDRVGAFLIGYHDCDGKLIYAGKIGTGFTAQTHAELVKMFSKLRRDLNPFKGQSTPRGAIFLNPTLVAEIEYRRWPEGGSVQQGSFKGLRSDKRARDVVKETVR